VIGAVGPVGPDAPKRRRKDRDGQQEEGAGHFEPQNAADPAKGTHKSAQAARHASGCPARGAPVCRACGLSAHCCGSNRLSSGRRLGFGILRGAGDALAGNPPRDPQPDSQRASDLFSSHFVMMVAATVVLPFFSDSRRFALAPGRQRK
jgi:hypothetical protein